MGEAEGGLSELDEARRQFKGAMWHINEAGQILGRALGYPKLYPIVSDVDDGQVCIGEHVIDSIAEEAARRICEQAATIASQENLIAQLRAQVGLVGVGMSDKAQTL